MEKHSFDQTPFLTVAFTVDCQNTTKSILKKFSPHPTGVYQNLVFIQKMSVSNFMCINLEILKKPNVNVISIFQIFRQKFLFDPLGFWRCFSPINLYIQPYFDPFFH